MNFMEAIRGDSRERKWKSWEMARANTSEKSILRHITQHAGRGSNDEERQERDGVKPGFRFAPASLVATFSGMRKSAHAKNQPYPSDGLRGCKTGYVPVGDNRQVPRPFNFHAPLLASAIALTRSADSRESNVVGCRLPLALKARVVPGSRGVDL